jgi:hypothetical protein
MLVATLLCNVHTLTATLSNYLYLLGEKKHLLASMGRREGELPGEEEWIG